LLFIYAIILTAGIIIFLKPGMIEYMLPSRFALDSNHFLISTINILISLISLYIISSIKQKSKLDRILLKCIFTGLLVSIIAGFFMLVQFDGIYDVVKYAYTLFDISQVLLTICTLTTVFKLKINFLSNSKLTRIKQS
jgi:hypothetical protein